MAGTAGLVGLGKARHGKAGLDSLGAICLGNARYGRYGRFGLVRVS